MREANKCIVSLLFSSGVLLCLVGCPTAAPNFNIALMVYPNVLNFGTSRTALQFTIKKNFTSKPLPPIGVSVDKTWVTVSPEPLKVDREIVNVTIDRDALGAGIHTATITIQSPGIVPKSVTVRAVGKPTPSYPIVVDGQFGDWTPVPANTDPVGNTHDTDHDQPDDVPVYVEHEDVDLIEYKMTHDANNLYAYFKSVGVIGRTQTHDVGQAGRYYVIVTMDVDNNETTGYGLHEGGYYPTSYGYDMNMEVEYFDGAFNTGHYLNHGCLNQAEFLSAQADQSNGIVDIRPGTYDYYTQWVWWDTPQNNPGEIILPDGHSTIIWVEDRGPVYQGITRIALSPDGHQAEMVAPFRGFMNYPNGDAIMKLGHTIKVSFSLEASGELAPGGDWASNTAEPITYYLASPTDDSDGDGMPDGWESSHGLDPGSDVGDDGASGDPDHDGFSNLAEYTANTDPKNTGSFPH